MNGRENGLHCVACRVFGVIVSVSVIAGLVAVGAWGALVFIAVGTPLVGYAERLAGR